MSTRRHLTLVSSSANAGGEGDRGRGAREGREGPTDAQLVIAARGGEAWAREALFRRYTRMVNGLAWRLMPNDAELDDLVQDVFVQALSSLPKLTEPAAFGSWLGSIVVRTAHGKIRRRRMLTRLGLRRDTPIDPDTVVSEAAPAHAAAELKAVYAVLGTLPSEARVALVLRRVEGMKLEEIAVAMDLSLATVKRRLEAAEKALAAKFVPEAAPGGEGGAT